MLDRQSSSKPRARGQLDPVFHEPEYIRYADIAAFFRRYLFTILGCVALGLLIAGLYVKTATPLYTARAQILIDPSTAQFIQDKRTELTLDAAKIESQIAILRSDTIIGAVVKEFDLQNDPEFRGGTKSLLRGISYRIYGGSQEAKPQSDDKAQTRIAIQSLRSHMDIRRAGLSYAIDIYVTTRQPEKSARIANAIADQYERDQVAARTRAARQWSEWLETRIHRLRGQLDSAARALLSLKSGREYPPEQKPAGAGHGAGEQPTSVAVAEATVEAYRSIYASYFSALTNAVEQESSPAVNARVITVATPPLGKSHPRSKLTILFGMFAGLISGVGIAFLRLAMDTSVRTPKQIKDVIGLDCLARVPRVMRAFSLARKWPFIPPEASRFDRLSMFRYVIEAPFSQFAGSVTALKSGLVKSAKQDGIRLIGVTSALPEEGKSTLAANLAAAFALSSFKALIIDADVHNSVISQTLGAGAKKGLLEVLKGEAQLSECVIARRGAGPDVLPLVKDKQAPVSYNWLSSESMVSLLNTLKDEYHFIVMDMPPLTPIADGLAISSMLDGVLLAVEWGKTPRDLLADVTYGLNLADANILGVVLTKVDESAVNLRLKKSWKYY